MLALAIAFLAAATFLREAAQYDCGGTYQEYLNSTNLIDLGEFDAPFDFEIYATANNFSHSKPGDVLKLLPVDNENMQIHSGIVTYKIQYTSVELNNTSTVPATAFVAFPYVNQSDPLKLVAFAQGTSSVFRGCAPSTSSDFYDYDTWIPLLFAGYSVVGTDYAGLGNNYTSHKYLSASANANDVYWSIVAAKKASPQDISDEWVSIGHSQGGGASWKLSESALVQNEESGYLGGVAIAPNTHLHDALTEGLDTLQNPSGGGLQQYEFVSYVPAVFFALKAVYPEYTLSFLSDIAERRFELGELAQLCAAALPAVVQDLHLSQIFTNLDPSGFFIIKAFQELNAPAQGAKTSKPLLVVVGQNDTTVYPSITTRAYKQSCKVGNIARLSIYPGLEHSPVYGASAPEWIGFIDNLFRGCGLHSCSIGTMSAFDAPHATKHLESD